MKNVLQVLGLFIGGLVTVLLFIFGSALLFSFPVKWLWNLVVVDLFHVAQIGYWQAFGLFVLTGILFRTSNTYNKEK